MLNIYDQINKKQYIINPRYIIFVTSCSNEANLGMTEIATASQSFIVSQSVEEIEAQIYESEARKNERIGMYEEIRNEHKDNGLLK